MDMTTPPDLAIMLDAEARLALDRLPDRRRRRYIEPIVQATRPDMREHRIARTIRMLREESER
jgi:uncharacterized protein YdeI (YjbR/CyaY-like superfamily)